MVTPVTIERILLAACERYGVSIEQVKEVAESERQSRSDSGKTKKRRKNNAAYAKQAVYYLAVRYLMCTPKLWYYLGDKDHTQQSKAFRKLQDLKLYDKPTHYLIQSIEEELEMLTSANKTAYTMIMQEEMALATNDKEKLSLATEMLIDMWLDLAGIVSRDSREQRKLDNHFQLPLFQ